MDQTISTLDEQRFRVAEPSISGTQGAPPAAPLPSAPAPTGKTAANSLPDDSTGATLASDPRS